MHFVFSCITEANSNRKCNAFLDEFFTFAIRVTFVPFAYLYCIIMEQLTLTTPSLLFSAVSLILLAYTNRFIAYAQVIRNLKSEYERNPTVVGAAQIKNLRERLYLTRAMQVLGMVSLLLCVVTMFTIYIQFKVLSEYIFGVALLCLISSLVISIREILISARALDIHLDAMTKSKK